MVARLAVVSALALWIATTPGASATLSAASYSVRPDGSDRTLVWRSDPSVDVFARSQDGQKIAFWRDSGSDSVFYVTDVAGKDPVPIQPGGYPVIFSPDDSRLLVEAASGLYVVNSDGTDARLVAHGTHASWSPGGGRVAYLVRTGDFPGWHSEIHVANADGSADATIGQGLAPQWAPRGNRIAYLAYRRGFGIPCFVNPDGSHRRCYHGFSFRAGFVWSPDGKRVASTTGSPSRIIVVTARGNHIWRLPESTTGPEVVAWSPDGRRLAYLVRYDASSRQIYMRAVAGHGREWRVTNEQGFCCSSVRWLDGRISYGVID